MTASDRFDGTSAAPTKRRKRDKNLRPEQRFHQTLTACSKSNDAAAALALYDSTDIHLSSHHFNTLLHILSNSTHPSADSAFRIFDRMVQSGVLPTEATITSLARIAAADSSDGGDRAFDLVRSMGERYGLSPRLRTYSPVLLAFCARPEDAGKAYEVEENMVSVGVVPEEQELSALLKVSSEAGREERVYGYLQKLRGCVRSVEELTVEVVEKWFRSALAGEVGTEDSDVGCLKDVILMNGGGWHGKGWIGKGRWSVTRSKVGSEGCCLCCGERLACVDIGQVETEKFAESIASLAMEREISSNFGDFQDWISDHADYGAIIDGANVGFYQQNFADGGFSLSQLENVVEELFKRKARWPLVIIHNKRLLTLMENPSNRQILEDWRAKGALYATPSGSNDDWYWLYAAVKLKGLLLTNDEMRDHIFELLGSNYFTRWKERHQVRYTFLKGALKLEMPRPYSTLIQESEKGSWHLPMNSSCEDERLRTWLCVSRNPLKDGAEATDNALNLSNDFPQNHDANF